MTSDPALAEWIIDQTTDALIYADREGKIARWNQAACRVFGYSQEEAISRSLDIIIPEPMRAAHWAGFNAALSSGKTKLDGRPTLTRAAHKEGRKIYVEMTFAVVKNDEGEAIGSVAMARDVTERIEKEREARRAQAG